MKTLVRLRLVLAITLLFALPALAQQNAPASRFQPQAEDKAKERAERRERHPHIRGAIRELQEAKNDLQHADHDFGGHRADAVKACDEAIHQLMLALQSDKK